MLLRMRVGELSYILLRSMSTIPTLFAHYVCKERLTPFAGHSILKDFVIMNTKDNPLQATITFRLQAAEKTFLQQQADKCRLSLSDFCREVLLGFSPRERLTKEQLSMLSDVRALRNSLININNFEKWSNYPDTLRKENEVLILRLNKILKKIGG